MKKIDYTSIVKQIKTLIKSKGLTSSEFADKIGLNRSNLSHILSKRHNPSLDVIMRIEAQFPEVDLDWLIKGVQSPVNENQKFTNGNRNPDAILKNSSIKNNSDVRFVNKKDSSNSKKPKEHLTEIDPNSSISLNKKLKKEPSSGKKLGFQNVNVEQIIENKLISKIIIWYNDGTFEVLNS